jgi:hypothetical protein
MFITCALVVAVLMLAAEKHQATAFAPVDLNFFLSACTFLNRYLYRLESVSPYSPATCKRTIVRCCTPVN